MKFFIIFLEIFIVFVNCLNMVTVDRAANNNTNVYLNTLQIIRKYGYPAESHIIETRDGYLLEMHRIPHGKINRENYSNKKIPIFLHHGLLGSSIDFLILGSENALPFLLADLGYDIWLGNARGNVYSRAHTSLFTDEKKFWNYTWHHSAIYDVPAQIDFICHHTKHQKIVYIGFSMGTTIFFVMTSTLPEYNDKIEISLLMAPVAYVKNVKSPLIRFLAPYSERIKEISDLIQKGEFLPNSLLLKVLGKIFCEENRVEKRLCMSAIFLIVGSDPKEFDEDLLPSLINHYPAGYSAKAVNHFSQLVKSGKFSQYDYGKKGNILEYGTPTPPLYNLSIIRTPIYFYEGKNDYLSTVKDITHLGKHLTTLKKTRVISDPRFTHLDFLISKNVKTLVYDVIIKDLTFNLNDSNKVY